MFFSLFPFPEVATAVAFLLASVYIVFGVLGTNHAATENIQAYQEAEQFQEQKYQASTISHSEKSYYWHQCSQSLVAISEEIISFPQFFISVKINFPAGDEPFLKCFNFVSVPNRAPPVI